MNLPIYNCFHPILREKSIKITSFDENLSDFVNNMLETMRNADGLGLAANQVGDRRSLLIVDEFAGGDNTSKFNPLVLINPTITAVSESEDDYREGCLSIPQYYEYVSRPTDIEVEYQDADGGKIKLSAGKLLARIIQHEVDHLNGILFFDHLTPLKRALSKSKLRRIEKGDTDAHYNMINPDGTENLIIIEQ